MIHYFSLWETVWETLRSCMGRSTAVLCRPSAKGSYLTPRTDQIASTEKSVLGSLGVQLFTSPGSQISLTRETGAQSRHSLVQSCILLLA